MKREHKLPEGWKSIECRMVKIAHPKKSCITRDQKFQIECGTWLFPCPSYRYSDIKSHLEGAIKDVLHLENEVEVLDFMTNIVSFD